MTPDGDGINLGLAVSGAIAWTICAWQAVRLHRCAKDRALAGRAIHDLSATVINQQTEIECFDALPVELAGSEPEEQNITGLN